VQNELGPYDLHAALPRKTVGRVGKKNKEGALASCREHGIAFVATKVFGGLGSRQGKRHLAADFPAAAKAAAKHGTPHDVVLGALLKTHAPILAIVGARSINHVPDLQRVAMHMDLHHGDRVLRK
jgi:aryl-alcohol dehydrogenase-like predicted oxidoreductase